MSDDRYRGMTVNDLTSKYQKLDEEAKGNERRKFPKYPTTRPTSGTVLRTVPKPPPKYERNNYGSKSANTHVLTTPTRPISQTISVFNNTKNKNKSAPYIKPSTTQHSKNIPSYKNPSIKSIFANDNNKNKSNNISSSYRKPPSPQKKKPPPFKDKNPYAQSFETVINETKKQSNTLVTSSTKLVNNNSSKNSASIKHFKETSDDVAVDNLHLCHIDPLLKQMKDGTDCLNSFITALKKFSQQQMTQSNEFLTLFNKSRKRYAQLESIPNFTFCMELVHQLLLETVKNQYEFGSFINEMCLPMMNTLKNNCDKSYNCIDNDYKKNIKSLHISNNELKKLKQQLETAGQSAVRNRQKLNIKNEQKTMYSHNNKRSAGKNATKLLSNIQESIKQTVTNKMSITAYNDNNSSSNPSSKLEESYKKAEELDKKFKLAVTNYNNRLTEYNKLYTRSKQEIVNMEHNRMDNMLKVFSKLVEKQEKINNNKKLNTLKKDINNKISSMSTNKELNKYIEYCVEKYGKYTKPESKKQYIDFEFRDIFYSMKDAMEITYQMDPNARMPYIVPLLCSKIRDLNGFKTEGIFRKSPKKSDLNSLKRKLQNKDFNFDDTNVHTYASCLKEWLRNLHEPIIPQIYYQFCIDMALNNKLNRKQFEVFFSQMPAVNRETIKFLIAFLREIIQKKYSKITKMDLNNISLVFGPTLLRTSNKIKDPSIALKNSQAEKDFVVALIEKS